MLYLLLSIILTVVAYVSVDILVFLTKETYLSGYMSGSLMRRSIEDRIRNGTLGGFFVLACFGGIYILSGPIVLGLAILGLAILGPISVLSVISIGYYAFYRVLHQRF